MKKIEFWEQFFFTLKLTPLTLCYRVIGYRLYLMVYYRAKVKLFFSLLVSFQVLFRVHSTKRFVRNHIKTFVSSFSLCTSVCMSVFCVKVSPASRDRYLRWSKHSQIFKIKELKMMMEYLVKNSKYYKIIEMIELLCYHGNWFSVVFFFLVNYSLLTISRLSLILISLLENRTANIL